MKNTLDGSYLGLPPALWAEVEAAAHEEHRPVSDVVRDFIEHGLNDRRSKARAEPQPAQARPELTPQEAVARILELRKGNTLPKGMTIRDMQTYGRS